jgi:hypothetical protein
MINIKPRKMICAAINCPKVIGRGECCVYSPAGQKFRDRQGYCPVPDDGPNKRVIKAPAGKKRSGQQKQKKA